MQNTFIDACSVISAQIMGTIKVLLQEKQQEKHKNLKAACEQQNRNISDLTWNEVMTHDDIMWVNRR